MKSYDSIPFLNSVGQTIQPGDPVIIVTEGYSHRIKIRQGVYLGMREKSTVCRVSYEGRRWVDKGGKLCSYGKDATYGVYTWERNTTYWSNRIFKLA